VPPLRQQEVEEASTASSLLGIGASLMPLVQQGLLNRQAIQAGTASVLEGYRRIFRRTRRTSSERLLEMLRDEYPEQDRDFLRSVVRDELDREDEFQSRMAARIKRDVPVALADPDPDKRTARVEAIVARENRIIIAREQAMAERALAAVERSTIRRRSPLGAYWSLSETVKQHTPDCVAMSGHFWPWEVLDVAHPPLHHGCPCFLIGLTDALQQDLMTIDQLPDKDDAVRRAKAIFDQYGLIREAAQQWEIDAYMEWLEEAFDERLHPRDRRGRWRDLAQVIAAHPDVEVRASKHSAGVVLSMIRTKPEDRGTGKASAALRDLLDYADEHGLEVGLTPEATPTYDPVTGKTGKRGLSNAALKRWYASVGFKPNRGRHANYAFSESMVRQPVSRVEEAHTAGKRYDRRYPKGTAKGGEYMPRRGGDPGIRKPVHKALRHLLPHAPTSPAERARLGAGEWQWLGGRRVFVPEYRGFERRIGAHVYTSPPGSVNVYRDGTLLDRPERGAPGILTPNTTVPTNLRRHSERLSAPRDLRGNLQEPGARRLRSEPPATWDDFANETGAIIDTLGQQYGAQVQHGDVTYERSRFDDSGLTDWSGNIHFGRDTMPTIHRDHARRVAGGMPSDADLRATFNLYRAQAHEASHAVNPISPDAYTAPGAEEMEEALSEEVGHAIAVENLRRHGRTDVIDWMDEHPDDAVVRGSYRGYRHALRQTLDNLGIPRKQWGDVMFTLKFQTQPGHRIDRLRELGHKPMTREQVIASLRQNFDPNADLPALRRRSPGLARPPVPFVDSLDTPKGEPDTFPGQPVERHDPGVLERVTDERVPESIDDFAAKVAHANFEARSPDNREDLLRIAKSMQVPDENIEKFVAMMSPSEEEMRTGIAENLRKFDHTDWKQRMHKWSDDDDARNVLATAVREADASPIFRAFQEKYGPSFYAAIEPQPGDADTMGQRVGNRTFVTDLALHRTPITAEQHPGMGSAQGLTGIIRHEYGHEVFTGLTPEQRREFISKLPWRDYGDGTAPTLAKQRLGGLSLYAQQSVEDHYARVRTTGKSVTDADYDEVFAEAFAVATDKDYDPSKWAPWVQGSVDFIRSLAPAGRADPGVSPDPVRQADAFARSLGLPVYQVGGVVRDALRDRSPKDADYMAIAGPEAIANAVEARGHRSDPLTVRDRLVGVRAFGPDLPPEGIEIAPPRVERSTGPGRHDFEIVPHPGIGTLSHDELLRADAERRDFTVNALYRDLSTGEVVDPLGRGQDDLAKGVLHVISPDSFRDDPLRILRGLRFQSQQGLTPDDETLAQMRAAAGSMTALTRGGVSGTARTELDKMLMGDNVGAALRTMRDTGVLAAFLPELAPTVGFDQQSKYHSLSLDEHIISTLERAAEMHAPLDVRLALLFHDSGKPEGSFVGPDGLRHFYAGPENEAHEDVGARIAHDTLARLNYPQATVSRVTRIVRNHMVMPTTRPSKVRRWRAAVGPDLVDDLLIHRRADMTAKGEGGEDSVKALDAFEKVVRQESNAPATVRDLAVNGRDLIDAGIKPGPQMGALLQGLLNEVIGDPNLNRKDWLVKRALKLSPPGRADPGIADYGYAPDPDAPEEGEWVRRPDPSGTHEQGVAVRWRQAHDALVRDALQAMKGWGTDMQLAMARVKEQGNYDGNVFGGRANAQAAALMWELNHHARPNDTALYRGDSASPSGVKGWSESRAVANEWARRGGGAVTVHRKGTVKGLRVADYISNGLDQVEREWLVDSDSTVPLGRADPGIDSPVVDRAEAERWMADAPPGSWTGIRYHGTTPELRKGLLASGYDFHRGLGGRVLGPNEDYMGAAFGGDKSTALAYASSRRQVLELAFRFERPLLVKSIYDPTVFEIEKKHPQVSDYVEAVRAEGYDGLVETEKGGMVIGLRPEAVKVIRPEPAGRADPGIPEPDTVTLYHVAPRAAAEAIGRGGLHPRTAGQGGTFPDFPVVPGVVYAYPDLPDAERFADAVKRDDAIYKVTVPADRLVPDHEEMDDVLNEHFNYSTPDMNSPLRKDLQAIIVDGWPLTMWWKKRVPRNDHGGKKSAAAVLGLPPEARVAAAKVLQRHGRRVAIKGVVAPEGLERLDFQDPQAAAVPGRADPGIAEPTLFEPDHSDDPEEELTGLAGGLMEGDSIMLPLGTTIERTHDTFRVMSPLGEIYEPNPKYVTTRAPRGVARQALTWEGQQAEGAAVAERAKAFDGFTFTGRKGTQMRAVVDLDDSTSTTVNADNGATYVRGEIQAKVGRWVPAGTFERSFSRDENGKLVVKHDLMKLADDFQGEGWATAFNRHAEEQYRQMGVDRIELETAWVGGFAWARAGYLFKPEMRFNPMLDKFAPESQHDAGVRVAKRLRDERLGRAANVGVLTSDAAMTFANDPDATDQVPEEITQSFMDLSAALGRGELDSESSIARFGIEHAWTAKYAAEVGPDGDVQTRAGEKLWPGKLFLLGTGWPGYKPLKYGAVEEANIVSVPDPMLEAQIVAAVFDEFAGRMHVSPDDVSGDAEIAFWAEVGKRLADAQDVR
jgi:tRNA nucleotidyltransferase (CCA-adding enzyme)